MRMNQKLNNDKTKIKQKLHLDINKFIENWNLNYPFDRWWRKKYNVPFGSEIHRAASFIDMAIDYKEDRFFERLSKKDEIESDQEVDKIINSENNSAKKSNPIRLSKKDIDKEFEELDLDKY